MKVEEGPDSNEVFWGRVRQSTAREREGKQRRYEING
jgi:hypothetical protein